MSWGAIEIEGATAEDLDEAFRETLLVEYGPAEAAGFRCLGRLVGELVRTRAFPEDPARPEYPFWRFQAVARDLLYLETYLERAVVSAFLETETDLPAKEIDRLVRLVRRGAGRLREVADELLAEVVPAP